MKTDKAWQRIGSTEPYFGVLVDDRFARELLDKELLREFFDSGKCHVQLIRKTISRVWNVDETPRVLDFGCGVGRLLLAFARDASFACGVDVSRGMIKKARQHAVDANITNVSFRISNGLSGLPDDRYDLVHSFITLQHIPARKGYQIIRNLLGKVDAGGFAALHLIHDQAFRRRVVQLIKKMPGSRLAAFFCYGRPVTRPWMEMNAYDLRVVMRLLGTYGFSEVLLLPTDHGSDGVIVFARRNRL